MKATGMIRRTDKLGRICIPKEIRQLFNTEEDQAFEIYISDDCIILKKYERGCKFCNSLENLTTFKDIEICNKCFNEMTKFKGDK